MRPIFFYCLHRSQISSKPTRFIRVLRILSIDFSNLSPCDALRSMRLLLVRHGETEHNVAGLLAGVTDSLLTNHGLTQAQKLGEHLIRKRQLRFTHVFSSDLGRAVKTAAEIVLAQNSAHADQPPIQRSILKELREQDFGSFELVPWSSTRDQGAKALREESADFKPKETKEQMRIRADTFLDDFLLPLLVIDEEQEQLVAVVSHGLFLASLWRALLERFSSDTVTLSPIAKHYAVDKPLPYIASWSNTGFLELDIHMRVSEKSLPIVRNGVTSSQHDLCSTKLDANMIVCAINNTEHLQRLKRTRGGVGSSALDEKQKTLETFFKKPKIDG